MKKQRIYLRIAALLLCAVMVLGMTSAAHAADTVKFLRGTYEVQDGKVLIYGRDLPSGGTLTVSSDSGALDGAELSNAKTQKQPMTLYCLIDASSSLAENQKKMQKDILKTIASRMEEGDTVIFGYLDDDLTESDPMTSKDAVNTAADTIDYTVSTWYTNLYQGIVTALGNLSTAGDKSQNRALLILADGEDNGKSSTTEAQMILAIQSSKWPVYTIAVTNITPPGYTELENAKHLQRCSEESLGGFSLIPANENMSATTAAEKVLTSIRNSAVISIDADQFETGKDTSLMIRYQVNGLRYEDTITIYAADIPEKAGILERIPLWGYIAAGAVLLVLILVIILVSAKKKKKAEELPLIDADDLGTDSITGEVTDDAENADDILMNPPMQKFDENPPVIPGIQQPTKPTEIPDALTERCKVSMVALMHPEVHAEFSLPKGKGVTVGRTAERSDIVLNGSDANLSSRHLEMQWDGKTIYVRDLGSTNGTAVNSVKCIPQNWMKLDNGDTLRAGNYEYRVNCQKL